MKNQKNFIKNLKSKLALFLVMLLVLNIAPLPENAGNGIAPFILKSLSGLQTFVGAKLDKALSDETQLYFLKNADGTFEVNLSAGGTTPQIFELKADSATLALKSRRS